MTNVGMNPHGFNREGDCPFFSISIIYFDIFDHFKSEFINNGV